MATSPPDPLKPNDGLDATGADAAGERLWLPVVLGVLCAAVVIAGLFGLIYLKLNWL